jgi:hypothetical protein
MQRQIEKRIIASTLDDELSSTDSSEVLATLRAIMRVCGNLEGEHLKDHERALLDIIECLVTAMRERIYPEQKGRLH